MSRRSRRREKKRSRLAASMLAFVGGVVGAHKFYLGKPGQGIFFLMMMFMSAGLRFPISAIIGFIDGMKLLSMSDRAFDQKYNRQYVQQGTQVVPERRKAVNTRNKSKINKANPYKRSGIAKYKEFALEEAIEDFEKGLEIQPDDVALHFNLACAYSLTEKKEKIFYHLDKAVSLGFKDYERILKHDDLAYLRIQPEFEAFKKNGFRIGSAPKGVPEVKDDALLARLNRLSELRKKGILSEKEFVLERKKLLNR